jgi:hypothetical protein
VRQATAALLDAMVEDHERATGPWEIGLKTIAVMKFADEQCA